MEVPTRRTLPCLLLALTMAACGEEEACPIGELTGDELPCDCQGELVDALPGDGSWCECAEDGFHCALPDTGASE